MKEEIERILGTAFDVRRVEIDREWESHGVPCTKVEVYWIDDDNVRIVSTCTFSKANAMVAKEMAWVLASYMKKGLKDFE